MTRTLAGADIRGYYAALGVTLRDTASEEVSVRCFADPDAHRRGDRDPSCSVNLQHGAWHCYGCGAGGGAYDAALARGCSPRAAVDLMVAYGLTAYRAYQREHSVSRLRTRPSTVTPTVPRARRRADRLTVSEDDLSRWQAALATDTDLIARLTRERAWSYATMLELGLGLRQRRITIPVRDHDQCLVGLLRYQPWPKPGERKLLATRGTGRVLLPHPAAEPSQEVLLVEGEPDMIAARSHGHPAIAIPGADSWQPGWAALFTGRTVTIIPDADPQGRKLATRVADDLRNLASATVLDLAPERDDGYDLTDWLLEHRHEPR